MKIAGPGPISCSLLLGCLTALLEPGHAAQVQNDPLASEAEVLEEVVVTGSRIRRDEFSSPSPIQVLDVEAGLQIGISSIAELVQQSTVTNGSQIDASLNTAAASSNSTEPPAPGGVGSSNISLRGLDPARTLVLLDGRRLGSAGVRGAPSQPDISLIPIAMVERVEILTEGVSAVYGADAVAGVVNVILRDEFDGFEVMVNNESPADSGGDLSQASILAGVQGDRGSFQFAAEVFNRSRVTTGSRNWSQCLRNIEQLENGRIESVCRSGFFDNLGLDGNFNIAVFTPGQSDIGVPNWSSVNTLPAPTNPLIMDPGGLGRFPFVDLYNDQDERRAADLVGELERFSLVTKGSLLVDWWSNEEVYFESMYLNSQVFSRATAEQIFPLVPGQIPEEDVNGNIIVDAGGSPILVDNPFNPFPADFGPVFTLESLPQDRDVEREQARFVLGMRGDISDSTWIWDAFASYDRGIGSQAQPILFEPHLQLSLQTVRLNSAGQPVCGLPGLDSNIGAGFITPEECVPLNFANPDLFGGGLSGEGVLTAEEAAYLIGNRTNRTVVEQTMFSTYATGEWFTIGDNRAVAAAVGAEFRRDEIGSQNGIVGVLGLNAAENPIPEGSTSGTRDVFEAFAEVNLPLLDTLDVDAAVRYTDEENFGSEVTWRGRIAWTPIDYLTLSGSIGTSFRAPNLREQFLDGQGGGIAGSIDPCGFFQVTQAVQSAGSDSDPAVINLTNNCALAGVEVVDSDGNGFLDTAFINTNRAIPTAASGNAALLAETSDSLTATIQFTQPWFDSFDFDVAVSYWDIEIESTVEEQDPERILSNCYSDIDFPGLSSPFCNLQGRGIRPNGFSDQVSFIDISFINIGEQTAKGIDLNTRLQFAIDRFGLEIGWTAAATYQLEQARQVFSIADRDDNIGEIGVPEWRFNSTVSLLKGDWEFLIRNRFIGETRNDQQFDFEANTYAPLLSRPVTWVDSTWYTDLSLSYVRDAYTITVGSNNLFDESPPLIESFAGPNRNNAVTSSGYDLFGRSLFATATVRF